MLGKEANTEHLEIKCKSLGRSIKTQRVLDVTSLQPSDIGNAMILDRETAVRLVKAYVRPFETAFRILHIPTFWT